MEVNSAFPQHRGESIGFYKIKGAEGIKDVLKKRTSQLGKHTCTVNIARNMKERREKVEKAAVRVKTDYNKYFRHKQVLNCVGLSPL